MNRAVRIADTDPEGIQYSGVSGDSGDIDSVCGTYGDDAVGYQEKLREKRLSQKQVTVSFWVDRWGNSIIIDFIEQQSGGIAWRD